MNAKIIEVQVFTADDGATWVPVGALHMELHEWQAMRSVLHAAVRNMRDNVVGIEIEDGSVPRIVN